MDNCNNGCGNTKSYLKPLNLGGCVANIPTVFGKEMSYYERVCREEQAINDAIKWINDNLDCLIAERIALIKLAGDYTEATQNLKLYLQSRCDDVKNANAGVRTKSASFVVDFKDGVATFKSKLYDYLNFDVTVNGNTVNLTLSGGQYIFYVEAEGKTELIEIEYGNGKITAFKKQLDEGFTTPFSFTGKGSNDAYLTFTNVTDARVKISMIKIGG